MQDGEEDAEATANVGEAWPACGSASPGNTRPHRHVSTSSLRDTEHVGRVFSLTRGQAIITAHEEYFVYQHFIQHLTRVTF